MENNHLLNKSQLAVKSLDHIDDITAKFAEARRQRIKDVMSGKVAPGGKERRARFEAAEMYGINSRYVGMAMQVRQYSPDLLKDIMDGKMSLGKAIEIIQSNRKNPKQRKVSKLGYGKRKNKNLIKYSCCAGKRGVYESGLTMASSLKGPIVSLTFPGENCELEYRLFSLFQQYEKNKFMLLERDKKRYDKICSDFQEDEFVPIHGSWENSKKFLSICEKLNFMFLDFMGAISSRQVDKLSQILKMVKSSQMVFMLTVGVRGGAQRIHKQDVADCIKATFKNNGWDEVDYSFHEYPSKNRTPMLGIVFKFQKR